MLLLIVFSISFRAQADQTNVYKNYLSIFGEQNVRIIYSFFFQVIEILEKKQNFFDLSKFHCTIQIILHFCILKYI